jgi:histidinol dehydrogenase
VHVINYSEQALSEVSPHVVHLAHAEDLPGHAAAITARFPGIVIQSEFSEPADG